MVKSDEDATLYEATPASYIKVEEHKDAEFAYGAYIDKTELPYDYEIRVVTEYNGNYFEFK